jgi:16S rRNA (guanine527-N7)-methyltransferase
VQASAVRGGQLSESIGQTTGNALNTDAAIESAREILIGGLGELELTASPAQIDALLALASLLAKWSRRLNLTAHRALDAIVRRLLLEAAALAAQIPPVMSLADIGSGAGFPGLPIAVLRPECDVTLVEARQKRHHFQRAVVRELGLSNATLELGRAENLEPRSHAAVIAQALAPPARALPWLLPWVVDGGLVLLPGSAIPPEVPARSDVSFEATIRYRVPCGGPDRTLWIGRRRSC